MPYRILISPVLLGCLCAQAFGVEYSVTQIPIVPGGYQTGTATSVDNQGEVAGYDTATNGDTQAFYWTQAGGSVGLTGIVGEGGATYSQAVEVNNGNVVGTLSFDNVQYTAFRWTPTDGLVLLSPGQSNGAWGVNGFGEVVGTQGIDGTVGAAWSSTNTLISLPFSGTPTSINNLGEFIVNQGFYNDGIGSTLVPLGQFSASTASSLSDNQVVVGHSYLTVASYEYLHDGTSIITIGTLPGDVNSNALGVNPLGTEIVGVSFGQGGFIYSTSGASAGSLQSLTSLLAPAFSGWTITSANSINDSGWIVGQGVFNGNIEAVLLIPVPVPEPSSLVLCGLGAASLYFVARRRRKV